MHDLNRRIYSEAGYKNEDGYQEVIEEKLHEIWDRTQKKGYKVINKCIDPSIIYCKFLLDFKDFLLKYYSNHTNSFKINLGLGYILFHTIKDICKYHYVSANKFLFRNMSPRYVPNVHKLTQK